MITRSPFITEAAIEFSIAIFVLVLRLISRWNLVGFRGWGIDDYLCIVAGILVTYLMAPVFLVGKTLQSNTGWTPEQRAAFNPTEIHQMQVTTKLIFAAWFAYVGALWSLKGAVLVYYNRIMSGVAQQLTIRVTGAYCGLSFIAVVLAIALHCRPFNKLWQIYPDPGLECSAYYTTYIIVVVFNVTTDILLVYIPIPVLVHLRIKIYQKIIVGILLCSGIFIIVAALLRCVLSLIDISQINLSAVWTVREIFVAFVAVNSPVIKPLFNPLSWKRLREVVDFSDKRSSHLQAHAVTTHSNGSFDTHPPNLEITAPSAHSPSAIRHYDQARDWAMSSRAANIKSPEQALYDYA